MPLLGEARNLFLAVGVKGRDSTHSTCGLIPSDPAPVCAILSKTAAYSLTRKLTQNMAIIKIESSAKQIVQTVQDYSLFAWRAFTNLFTQPRYLDDFLLQSDIIGVGSTSIVLLSGFFTGGVLALQSAATLSQFGATAVTGQFVSLTMIR